MSNIQQGARPLSERQAVKEFRTWCRAVKENDRDKASKIENAWTERAVLFEPVEKP